MQESVHGLAESQERTVLYNACFELYGNPKPKDCMVVLRNPPRLSAGWGGGGGGEWGELAYKNCQDETSRKTEMLSRAVITAFRDFGVTQDEQFQNVHCCGYRGTGFYLL